MQDTDSVKHKVILLFYILPETQIKMSFCSYHQDAQDNKIICVPPSMKISYLPSFISEDNFFLGYFWMCSKQSNFILANIISPCLMSINEEELSLSRQIVFMYPTCICKDFAVLPSNTQGISPKTLDKVLLTFSLC